MQTHTRRVGLVTILILVFTCSLTLYGQDKILELKEKIIDIQNEGQLGFRNFTLCSNIIGYGQYVPINGNKITDR